MNLLKLVGLVTSTTFLLSGCFPAPKYIDITQKGKLAVVSFSLDRSVTMENSGEIDNGPGLLQKMVKGKEKAEEQHFEYHKQALDTVWAQFKENIGDAMLGISIVDFNDIINNGKLLEMTKHKEKKIMGQDVSSGARMLNPEGMNYVNAYSAQVLDSICVLLNAGLLLLIENRAQFDEVPPPVRSENGALVISPKATAYIKLKTRLYVHEKGNGLVANKEFETKSDDKMVVVWKSSNPKDYPKLLLQANAKVYDQIKQHFLYQKQKSVAP